MVHFFLVLEFSRVVGSSALPKLCQSCKEVLHSTLPMYHIVPCTHIHGHVGHLLLTNNCMQKEEGEEGEGKGREEEGREEREREEKKEREERGRGRRGRGRREGGRRGGGRKGGGRRGGERRGEEGEEGEGGKLIAM